MARVYYANSNIARSTVATTTFGNKVTLTFTPTANRKYVGLWVSLLDNDSATNDGRVRANNLSRNVVEQTFNYEAQDPTDVYATPGMFFFEAGATPTAQTYAVQFSSESTNVTGIADAYLTVLELDSNDKFMANATSLSLTTATYTNVGNTQLTCTAGDWLIIASAEINSGDTTPATTLLYRLYNHTTATEIANTGAPYVKDATNFTPLWMMYNATFASNTVIGLQMKSDGAATILARNTRMLALDLSKFRSYFIKQDLPATTVTSTTQVNVEEFPLNFLARDNYLLLFASTARGSSTADSSIHEYYINYEEGDIRLNSEPITREQSTVNEFYDFGGAVVSNISRRKATIRQKANVETGGTNVVVKNNVIAVLQLGDAPRERRRVVLG